MVQRAPPHHQLGRRVTERLLFVRRGTRSAQAQEQRQCSIGSYILTPLRRHILTSLRMRNIFRLSTSKPKRRRKAFLSSRAKKALSWRKNAEPHSGGMQRCWSAGARRLVVTHTQGFGKRAAPFRSSRVTCLRHRPGSLQRCPPRILASSPPPTPTAPHCRPQGSATVAAASVVGFLRLVGCDNVLQSRFSRCCPLTRDYC